MEQENDVVSKYNTMVRYNNPVLVAKHPQKKYSGLSEAKTPLATSGLVDDKRRTDEILNSILPPRCWVQSGQLWTQMISSTPANRQDVINLQETLDTRLQQTQARETGICSIRRELYAQCLDELIRQVTINCAERGLLLLRCRDEITMTLEAFETLYCSSVAYGLRKALAAHEEKEDLRNNVRVLEDDKASLEAIITELQEKAEHAETLQDEIRQTEKEKYSEELYFLRKEKNALRAQLELIITPKK